MRPVVAAVVLVTATAACAPDGPDPAEAAVGIVVEGCDPGVELGSGLLIEPGLALTSAHVVAGARTISVRHGGEEHTGEIVGFDPEMDLAYLSVPATRSSGTIAVDSDRVEAGDEGTAWVVREGSVVGLPVTVRRRVKVRTEDIYIEGETLRPSLELDAEIRRGDSGGAVVIDGRVVGVLSLRSNRFDRRAYAVDPDRAGGSIERQLADGALGPDVDVTRC